MISPANQARGKSPFLKVQAQWEKENYISYLVLQEMLSQRVKQLSALHYPCIKIEDVPKINSLSKLLLHKTLIKINKKWF